MRIGVQLPEAERVVRWPEVVAMARAAEEVGFDSIWLGDHLLYRGDGREERGPWEVWTQLAGLAAVTERVRLGPLVACASFHPPGLIAKMAASVDDISGGRFVLGLGAGWNETEYRAFGLPYDHRVSRFEESFEIVRRVLAGERVTLDGRFWQAEDLVLLPPPARRIPLMIGSNGAADAVDRAAARGLVEHLVLGLREHGRRLRRAERSDRAAAERAGRDPAEVSRSTAVLVELDPTPSSGPHSDKESPPCRPRRHCRPIWPALAEAGADEAILILRPIDEASIRAVGRAIPLEQLKSGRKIIAR